MREILAAVEAELDPARPTGVEIMAYGEVSAALRIPDLPGRVAKRMSGFADAGTAAAYCALVGRYVTDLQDSGVEVVPTELITIERPARPPVVYLVQPLVSDLGQDLLHSAGDARLAAAMAAVMDRVWVLHGRTDPVEIAVDAQLSNWSFTQPDDPVLIDVGTPIMRLNGQHLFDHEILLAAIPPGLRAYHRHRGAVAQYFDDYFDPRLVAIDLLGNFIKERAGHRLGAGTEAMNVWLQAHGLVAIDMAEVTEYYRRDAATLELFLRVRRVDRAVRRALGRDYDFVLPGRVSR